MTSYLYKEPEKQKSLLAEGDWILFQEAEKIPMLWSGRVVSIDRASDAIIVCTDLEEGTQDDFILSQIILHIERDWDGFEELADMENMPITNMY